MRTSTPRRPPSPSPSTVSQGAMRLKKKTRLAPTPPNMKGSPSSIHSGNFDTSSLNNNSLVKSETPEKKKEGKNITF